MLIIRWWESLKPQLRGTPLLRNRLLLDHLGLSLLWQGVLRSFYTVFRRKWLLLDSASGDLMEGPSEGL